MAILAGALGCGTLIVHNLLTDFGSVREALSKSAAYTEMRGEDPEPYPIALALELKGLVGTLAGAIGDRRDAEVQLTDPSVRVWIVLAPVALVVAARLGVWLPVLLVLPFVLILPAFNANFDPLLEGRYFMPLVPIFATVVALLLAVSWRKLGRVTIQPTGAAVARALLAGAAALVLVASPMVALRVYEQAALAEGGNAPYYELADRIVRERQDHEHVLLDSDLGGERIASGQKGVSVLEYLLTMRPDPTPVSSARIAEVTGLARANPGNYLLVLLPASRQKLETRFRLTLVGRAPAPDRHRLDDVRLYRVREVR